MDKIKICHLTSVHPPLDIRIFHKECKALARAGYDVTLIAPHNNDETVNGVKIRFVPKAKTRMARFFRTIGDVYRLAVKEQADVYHFHDFELIPVALLLKMKGKKIIYDSHEDFPRQNLSREWIAKCLRSTICFITEIFENISVRFFDTVVGATPNITRRFKDMGCDAINVNNYPALSEIIPEYNEMTVREAKSVCFVGAMSRNRGIIQMVEAIGYTNIELYLAGEIQSELLEELQSIPGWKQVKQMGYVSRKDIVGLLSKSLAGLVLFHPEPNHIYSQPTKMYEYMSAGIPVIASDFPQWRSVIEENNCGLCVDPMNPQAIATAIQFLENDFEKAEQMGKNGKRAIQQYYNWEAEEKKLLELYERLIAGYQRN